MADYGSTTVTSSNGPFRLTIDGGSVGTVREATPFPTEFTLYPNHPNPFNPSTVIRFDLPEEEYVSLVIYNLLGNEVRTLSEGIRKVGRHQAFWDGKDNLGEPLNSGIYFYSVNAGKKRRIDKMTLLK